MIDSLSRCGILILCLSKALDSSLLSQPKEFILDEGITWGKVFDVGFRPKHLPSLEPSRAIVEGQSFQVRVTRGESAIEIGKGRTTFAVLKEGKINFIKHIESRPMPLAAALEKLDGWRRIGGQWITRDEFEIESKNPELGLSRGRIVFSKGSLFLNMGFRRSGRNEEPLVARYLIATQENPGLAAEGLQEPISPPPGYESHDMSPAYDYEAKLAAAQEAARDRERDAQRVAADPDRLPEGRSGTDGESGGESDGAIDWRWLVALVALLAVGVFGWRWVTSAD